MSGIEGARVLNVVHVCEAYVAHKRRTGRRSAGANYAPAGLHSSREPWRDIAAHIMSTASFIMVVDSVDFTVAWDRAGKLPAHKVFADDPIILNIATAYVQAAKLKRTARGIFCKEHASVIDKCEFDWDQVPAAFIMAAMCAHGGRSVFPGSVALIENAAAIGAFPAANPELPRAIRRLFEREHARQSVCNASRQLAAARQRSNASPVNVAALTRVAELAHFVDLNPLLPIRVVRLAAVLISKGLKKGKSRRRAVSRMRRPVMGSLRQDHTVLAGREHAQLQQQRKETAAIGAFPAANPELPRAIRRLFEREHARQSACIASRQLATVRQRSNASPVNVAALTRVAELAHFVDLNPLLPIRVVRLAAVLIGDGLKEGIRRRALRNLLFNHEHVFGETPLGELGGGDVPVRLVGHAHELNLVLGRLLHRLPAAGELLDAPLDLGLVALVRAMYGGTLLTVVVFACILIAANRMNG